LLFIRDAGRCRRRVSRLEAEFANMVGSSFACLQTPTALKMVVDGGGRPCSSFGMLDDAVGGVSRLDANLMPNRKRCTACHDSEQLTRCWRVRDRRGSRKSAKTSVACSTMTVTYAPNITFLSSAPCKSQTFIHRAKKRSAIISTVNKYMTSVAPLRRRHRFVHAWKNHTSKGMKNMHREACGKSLVLDNAAFYLRQYRLQGGQKHGPHTPNQ